MSLIDQLTGLLGGGNDAATVHLAALILGTSALLFIGACMIWHDRPIGVRSSKLPQLKPAYPLIGNLPQLLKTVSLQNSLQFVFEAQQKTVKKGMPFTITAPGPSFGGRATVINHPEYIQWVQKTNFENYDKGPNFRRNFRDVLSDHGIFAADGDVWRKQRKMASHIFSVGNFRTHVQKTIHQELGLLASLAKDVAAKQAPVNLQDIFFRFTLDSFGSMAFSADLECMPAKVEGLQKEVPFAVAFDFAQQVINERFLQPLWPVLELVTPQGRKMRSAVKQLRRTCYEIIDKRLSALASGAASGAVGSGGKDLLQLFIDQGLGREDLLPIVLNFIIAGRDTTAQALSWAFLELHRAPGVVEKIRAEAERVLGDRFMDYDDLKSMTYTTAVFYEVLRLHPSVPKNIKVANEDDVIRPYGQDVADKKPDSKELLPEDRLPDIPIQKGTTVFWSDWVMGRMPEIWGDDCLEFKPTRFLNEDGTLKSFSQYKFHAFNAGPRLCLGQTLATYEGCAVIVELLRKYDVVLDKAQLANDPPIPADSVTLPIKNPYKAVFVPRH